MRMDRERKGKMRTDRRGKVGQGMDRTRKKRMRKDMMKMRR